MISDDLVKKLASIVDDFEIEEEFLREQDLIRWSRNELYWKGFQYLVWSAMEGNWQIPNMSILEQMDEDVVEDLLYSKVNNIYKGHGSSIIAALSIDLPTAKFFPDDADDPEDVNTAKAYRTMADIIQRHNRAKLLFMHALFVLYNQDFAASYIYKKTDKKYGTEKTKVYAPQPQMATQCQECGTTVQDVNAPCPNCQGESFAETSVDVPAEIGEEESPKTRVCVEVYGPLYVKIPRRAKSQEECDILILEKDISPNIVRHTYGRDKLENVDLSPTEDSDKRYRNPDRIFEDKRVTVKYCWLRPAAFERLKVAEEIDQLKAEFPDGCYAVIINGSVVEWRAEELDSCWEISYDPLSETLHSDPMGESLIPLQDVKNDLLNYTLQTIEYGIPETFADVRAINWDAYKKQKSRHGQVFPARKPSDGQLSESFTTIKTTTLSREIQEFDKALDSSGQFVTGDYPSVYGGPSAGSKTLGEYAMSRNQALQRLSNTWKVLNYWWVQTIHKACKMFSTLIKDKDYQFVSEDAGNFVNVWIRAAHMQGVIGNVEPEGDESFPLSMGQKRDMILELLQLANPEINSVIFSIENATTIASIMGFADLTIPGVDQVSKQIEEGQILIQQQPLGEQPSIMPDPELDDHEIHATIAQAFLVSFRGRELAKVNPLGYQNYLLHFNMHKMISMQQAAQAAMVEGAGQEGETEPSVEEKG